MRFYPKIINQLLLAFVAFNVEGGFVTRVANLIVGLRWRRNTIRYYRGLGKPPNYVSPKCWTEKLQWRKVFDRNPLITTYSDKLASRDYMREHAPEVALPRIFWSGESLENIPFDEFNEPYVIKSNNASGNNLFVENPREVDRQSVVATCQGWLKKTYGKGKAEWGYWNVKPRLFIEEFFPPGENGAKPTNYKFFVFDGKFQYAVFESENDTAASRTYFDDRGERMPVRKWIGAKAIDDMLTPDLEMKIPSKYFEMKTIAERLGRDMDMVRVDLYQMDETIYFSEMTCYDGSGLSYLFYESEEAKRWPSGELNYHYGKMWKLPKLSAWEMFRNCMFC